MKILHYSSRLSPKDGGPFRSVVQLSEALADLRHQVFVLERDGGHLAENWSMRRLPGSAVLHSVAPHGEDISTVSSLIGQIDVLHIHSLWDPFSIWLAKLAQLNRVPYVVSPRGVLDRWSLDQSAAKKRLYLAVLGRRFLEQSNALHFTAAAEYDQVRRVIEVRSAFVIPNIPDLPNVSPCPKKPGVQGTPIVLFLSRLHPKKGVHHLLQAVPLLLEQGLLFRVIIAGPADDPAYYVHLQTLVRHFRLCAYISFVGWVDGSQKVDLLTDAEMLVLPTSSENFGHVIFEALAAGTPVVTTKAVDCWPDLISSGGVLVCAQSALDLANAIAHLLRNGELRSQMGERGRDWVGRYLDRAALAAEYQDMYRAVQPKGGPVL